MKQVGLAVDAGYNAVAVERFALRTTLLEALLHVCSPLAALLEAALHVCLPLAALLEAPSLACHCASRRACHLACLYGRFLVHNHLCFPACLSAVVRTDSDFKQEEVFEGGGTSCVEKYRQNRRVAHDQIVSENLTPIKYSHRSTAFKEELSNLVDLENHIPCIYCNRYANKTMTAPRASAFVRLIMKCFERLGKKQFCLSFPLWATTKGLLRKWHQAIGPRSFK